MRAVIAPFTDEWTGAVKAFNSRLRQAGVALQFPESPHSSWLPKLDGRRLYEEYYLALEDEQVRGAYAYKQQDFMLQGQSTNVGYYRLPLSEGSTDKRFASVGVQLLLDALRKNPLLYSLGIGSSDDALTKMLSAAGWSTCKIPFYFRVHRPARFLRNIKYLRRSRLRRIVLDLLAWCGLGTLLVGAYQALKTREHRRLPADFQGVEEKSFGPWADQIWQTAQSNYSLIAVRDATSLNILYPAGSRFIRLRVDAAGRTVGWAVVLNSSLDEHSYFGSMQLGSLVDCLALPGHEANVTAAAVDHLKRIGADLTIANLSHRNWCSAAEACGFLQGPSNFIFAASKKLAERLQPFDVQQHRLHMMRADGDGPHGLLGEGRS
jgi:hypothetical protein